MTSPLLSYLHDLESAHQPPKAFGLVHRKTTQAINIGSFYLNDSYVDAFSKGLQLSKKLKRLNMARNQLTSNRLIKVVQMMPRSMLDLNLSNNPALGLEAY